MQIKVHNGTVDLSGQAVLQHIEIEINTNSRIAVVGRNGSGKTTLLRLLSGELKLANPEGDDGFFAVSGTPVIGMQSQMLFADDNVRMVDEIRSAYKEILDVKSRLDAAQTAMESEQSEENIRQYTTLLDAFTALGGFYFEKEYEAAIKKFGFTDADKQKTVGEFSGGQRTKIAFLKLLLSKPDLLLLDEPTNHLDIEAVSWLEDYLRDYKKAFVIVSHDRMFLDRTVNEVYEIEHGRTERYIGGYTDFVAKKRERRTLQQKEYEAQQKEISRLSDLAERFRYKATKAAMAQSKLKQIEKMTPIESPDAYDNRTFRAKIEPTVQSAKDVLIVNGLKIGFESLLAEVTFELRRGGRLGIIGGNGLGKSTLLKTLVGTIPALGGEFKLGANVTVGYFDQQMAQYSSTDTVLDDFRREYPHAGDFEARSALGAFLFSGDDVFKTVDMLSGGERVRLALCKLLRKNPNFLILDEPTNHMDILSKETLEELLEDYTGTLLFVSHDRYFVNRLAQRLICFENDGVKYYDCRYDEYLEKKKQETTVESVAPKPDSVPKVKKGYTTPAKEKAKRERAIKKAEEKIAALEELIENLQRELQSEENISDYVKLSELGEKLTAAEDELLEVMEEWDRLTAQNGEE